MIAPSKDHVSSHAEAPKPEAFDVRILRQDAPGESPKWERFRIPYEPNLNIISVLMKIAAMGKNANGKAAVIMKMMMIGV